MLLLQVGSNCSVCIADLDLLCVERKRNANTCEQWYRRASAQTSCLKLNTINTKNVFYHVPSPMKCIKHCKTLYFFYIYSKKNHPHQHPPSFKTYFSLGFGNRWANTIIWTCPEMGCLRRKLALLMGQRKLNMA